MLSVQYITAQFKKLGLKPGNPNGTYTQEVPLAGILGTPTAAFTVGDKKMELHSPNDFVAFTQRIAPEVEVKNSDMVFVGYGVVAPEYGWDDFKGVDVKGKTLVFLINDPPIPDPNDPSKLDDKMFKGKAMTYYGRWSLQIRNRRREGRGRRDHRARDDSGRLSLVGSGEQQREGEFRDRCPGQEHGDGRRFVPGSRSTRRRKLFAAAGQDLRRAEEGGPEQGLQAGLVRRESGLCAPEQDPHIQVAQRRRQARRERPAEEG